VQRRAGCKTFEKGCRKEIGYLRSNPAGRGKKNLSLSDKPKGGVAQAEEEKEEIYYKSCQERAGSHFTFQFEKWKAIRSLGKGGGNA